PDSARTSRALFGQPQQKADRSRRTQAAPVDRIRSVPPGIQAKLVVSNAWEPAEREADAVAARILAPESRPVGPVAGAVPPGGDGQVHRMCAACQHDDEEKEETIQRRTEGPPSGAPIVTPTTAAALGRLNGRGQPLPRPERHFFEQRLRYDLSQVRIHSDPAA